MRQESRTTEESRNRPEAPEAETKSNLIDFNGPDDKDNPQNHTNMTKWSTTLITSLLTLTTTFASSIFSTAVTVVPQEFDVGQEVGILGVS